MHRKEFPLDLHHLGLPSGASKMISKPMVCLAQTLQLSCVKINTISKQTETSFDLTHVTKENHQLRPKWFLSLWYIQRKPCTFLVSRLTLSINGPKQASVWPLSPRSSIWWCPKWFLSLWYVRRKSCTYLASSLALSPNGPNRSSTWASSPRSSTNCVQNDFWAYGMFGANHAPILQSH